MASNDVLAAARAAVDSYRWHRQMFPAAHEGTYVSVGLQRADAVADHCEALLDALAHEQQARQAAEQRHDTLEDAWLGLVADVQQRKEQLQAERDTLAARVAELETWKALTLEAEAQEGRHALPNDPLMEVEHAPDPA